MKAMMKRLAPVALLAFGALGSAYAADWELWPDPTTWPDPLVGLPLLPPGKTSTFTPGEADTNWLWIDVHQTREKDGKLYKAVQLSQDTDLEATVPVGKWLWGGFCMMEYPADSGVDVKAMWTAWRLLSIELDGTLIPIDMDTYRIYYEFSYEGTSWNGASWKVFPKFNTTGRHTYKMTFKQVEEFFFVENFEAHNAFRPFPFIDPSPEFEGRRVYVGEQVGNLLDGDIVCNWTLNVVEDMAVSEGTWGQIKALLK